MQQLLCVAAGGALGASLRFGLCALAHMLWGQGFPYGTLLVNTIGGFAIGMLAGGGRFHPLTHTGIVVGLLGGFTTFSSFSWDTLSLALDGSAMRALANVLANVLLALLAVWGGLHIGRSL